MYPKLAVGRRRLLEAEGRQLGPGYPSGAPALDCGRGETLDPDTMVPIGLDSRRTSKQNEPANEGGLTSLHRSVGEKEPEDGGTV